MDLLICSWYRMLHCPLHYLIYRFIQEARLDILLVGPLSVLCENSIARFNDKAFWLIHLQIRKDNIYCIIELYVIEFAKHMALEITWYIYIYRHIYWTGDPVIQWGVLCWQNIAKQMAHDVPLCIKTSTTLVAQLYRKAYNLPVVTNIISIIFAPYC